MSRRILFIQPSYFPANQSSGPNLSLHLLAKTLVRHGWDVTVYTTDYDVGKTPDVVHNVDGVKVIYFHVRRHNYWGQIGCALPRQLNRDIANFDYIYITPIWNPVLWYPLRLVANSHVPLIISPRGGLCPQAVKGKNFFLKRVSFYLLRRYIQKAALIHYSTQSEKDDSEKYWGKLPRGVVFPNGLDRDTFARLPADGLFKKKYNVSGRFLLSMGRINWIKGLDITAQAFSRLHKEFPDLQWVIAGRDDGYQHTLTRQMDELGCRDNVKFVGLLQGEDKLAAFVDAEIFVFPSYSESFGMAVVEALACGVPVILSNKVGVYQEVQANKAGIVVEPTVDDLYEGLSRLLTDQTIRGDVARRGKQLVGQYYDIQKVADQMIRGLCEMNDRMDGKD